MENLSNERKLPQKSGTRLKNAFLFLALMCVAAVFALFIRYQYGTLMEVELRINQIQHEISSQKALAAELEKERDLYGSNEFYERVARETLGMVYKNDIIFKIRK